MFGAVCGLVEWLSVPQCCSPLIGQSVCGPNACGCGCACCLSD